MPGVYGGLVVIMIYGGFGTAIEQEFSLITQDNLFILTQLSQDILVQVPV